MKYFGFSVEMIDHHVIVDEALITYLKAHLKPERYKHSFNVAFLCYKIAELNELNDPLKYFFAGLIHDIGKYVDKIETERIMKEEFASFVNLPDYSYHAFVGAYLAEKDLKINDKEILESIIYHTSGRENMSIMEKIVYAADKIDPGRQYDSYDLILSMFNDYNRGFLDVLKANKDFLESKGIDSSDFLTLKCFKFYLGEK